MFYGPAEGFYLVGGRFPEVNSCKNCDLPIFTGAVFRGMPTRDEERWNTFRGFVCSQPRVLLIYQRISADRFCTLRESQLKSQIFRSKHPPIMGICAPKPISKKPHGGPFFYFLQNHLWSWATCIRQNQLAGINFSDHRSSGL